MGAGPAADEPGMPGSVAVTISISMPASLAQGRATSWRVVGFTSRRAGSPAQLEKSARARYHHDRHSRHAVVGRMTAATETSLGAASRATLERTLQRLDRFAHLSDSAYRIPVIGRRIGLDGLVGLVPGIGDGITALAALYPVIEAWRLGVPTALLLRMLANIGADSVLGAVPIAGDLFDFAFRANRRNVALLRRHLGRD
jgi:hypothetical protein